MKKKIIAVVILMAAIVVAMAVALTFGIGNRQIVDLHHRYDEAIISLSSGETLIRGSVDSWRDYDDGDQIQVTIDGVTYLTHASNIVLIDR